MTGRGGSSPGCAIPDSFGSGAGVADEEDGLRAAVQAEDDRVLVLVAHRDRLGMMHRDRHLRRIEGDRIAGFETVSWPIGVQTVGFTV